MQVVVSHFSSLGISPEDLSRRTGMLVEMVHSFLARKEDELEGGG